MNANQIELVQSSFARARRFGAHVAATFYAELFAIDPSLRNLFKSDMITQAQKLMAMLEHIVDNLHNADALLPAVSDMAVRHLA
jgi:nitric oxide dioxygenase